MTTKSIRITAALLPFTLAMLPGCGADPGPAGSTVDGEGQVATGAAEPVDEDVQAVTLMKASTPQCSHEGEEAGLAVPVANNGSSSCWMDQGDVSSGVSALQLALDNCWDQNLDLDADYGRLTKRAVRSVQQRLRISADGVYGPMTRRAMGNCFGSAILGICACQR